MGEIREAEVEGGERVLDLIPLRWERGGVGGGELGKRPRGEFLFRGDGVLSGRKEEGSLVSTEEERWISPENSRVVGVGWVGDVWRGAPPLPSIPAYKEA